MVVRKSKAALLGEQWHISNKAIRTLLNFWKDILFLMDFIPKYLQGMWQPFRGFKDPFWSPCQEKQQFSMSQGLFSVM